MADGNFEYGIEKGKEKYVTAILLNVGVVIIMSRFTMMTNPLRLMV
ncbi:MAG: hypothetical protein KKE04_03045 [Candidatus Thermoplasmatota archaeon]|nr:hypothetical protein [Candidatus Thermoplasmatota archaeon]